MTLYVAIPGEGWDPDRTTTPGIVDGNVLTMPDNEPPGGPGNYIQSFSVVGHATGKYYCEITVGGAEAYGAVGISNENRVIDGDTWLGSDANAIALWGAGGPDVWYNNAPVDNFDPSFTEDDVVGCAVDLDAELIWFRINSGDWNLNPSADPTTGVGGFDLRVTGSTFYVCVTGYYNVDVFTLDPDPPGGPSGFSAW